MSDGTPKPDVTSDDRMWAVLSHLANFVIPIFGPLVIWLVKKDDSPFVADQAKEALNFQLAVWIVSTVSVLTCVLAPVAIIVPVVALVLSIIAAVEANKGVCYRYPYIFRLIS